MNFDDTYLTGGEYFPLGEVGGGEIQTSKPKKAGKYVKALGKSTKAGVKGLLNMYLPEAMNLTSEIGTAFSETKDSVNDEVRKATNQVKSALGINDGKQSSGDLKSTISRMSNEIKRDVAKAVKTGNFTGESDDFSFGDDFGFGDEELGGGGSTVVISQNTQGADTSAILEGQSIVGQATLNQSQLHHVQRETSANVRHAQSFALQNNIATNVGKISNFLADVVGKNVTASMEYRAKDLALNKEIVETLRDMRAYAKSGSQSGMVGPKGKLESIFGYGLDGSSYSKNLMSRGKEMLASTPLGMVGTMMTMMSMSREMGMGGSSSLGNSLMKSMFKAIPGLALNDRSKGLLSSLDETIGALPATFNSKFNEMALYSDNPAMRFIGSMLGVNELSTKKANMGLKDPNAKAVFDQKVHRTITDVIPGLLSKIYASTSGEEEVFYDYKSGTFKKSSHAVKQYKYEREMAYNSSNKLNIAKGQIMGSIDSIAKDDNQKQEMQKDFNQIVKNIVDSKVTFDPNRAMVDDHYSKVLIKGLKNPNNLTLFIKEFTGLNQQDQTQFNIGVSAATTKVSSFYKNMGQTAGSRGGGLFVGEAMMDELQADREAMRNLIVDPKRFKAGTQARLNAEMQLMRMEESQMMEFGGRVKTMGSGGQLVGGPTGSVKPGVGGSSVSLLSNIYELLLGGIMVYPDNNGVPKHLTKRIKTYNTSQSTMRSEMLKREQLEMKKIDELTQSQMNMALSSQAQGLANQSFLNKVLKIDGEGSLNSLVDSAYGKANSAIYSMLYGGTVANAGTGMSKAQEKVFKEAEMRRKNTSFAGGMFSKGSSSSGNASSGVVLNENGEPSMVVDDNGQPKVVSLSLVDKIKGMASTASSGFIKGMHGTQFQGDYDKLYKSQSFGKATRTRTSSGYNKITIGKGGGGMGSVSGIPMDSDIIDLHPIITGAIVEGLSAGHDPLVTAIGDGIASVGERISKVSATVDNTVIHEDLTQIIDILTNQGVMLGSYSSAMEEKIREINISSLSFAFPHINLDEMNTMPSFRGSPYRRKISQWKDKLFNKMKSSSGGEGRSGGSLDIMGSLKGLTGSLAGGIGGVFGSLFSGAKSIKYKGIDISNFDSKTLSDILPGIMTQSPSQGSKIAKQLFKSGKISRIELKKLLSMSTSKKDVEKLEKAIAEDTGDGTKGSGLLGSLLGSFGLGGGVSGLLSGASGLLGGAGAGLGSLMKGGGSLFGGLMSGGGSLAKGSLGKIGSMFGLGKKGGKAGIGDSDGDGMRDGSYKEHVQERKEARRDKIMAELLQNVIAIRKSIAGGGGLSMGKGAETEEEGGGLFGALDTIDDIGDTLSLGASMLGGGGLIGGIKGAFGRLTGRAGRTAASTASRAGGLLGRGASAAGRGGRALSRVGSAATRAKPGGIMGKLTGILKKVFSKGPVKKFINPKSSGTIIKTITSKLGGSIGKIAGKLTGKLASAATPIGIGLLVADFVKGISRANRYFGVGASGNVTLGMKISSGVASLLSSLTLGLIPADLIVSLIFRAVGSDENKEFLDGSKEFLSQRAQLLGVAPQALSDYETAPIFQRLFRGDRKFSKDLGFNDVETYREWRDNKYKPLQDIYEGLRDSMGGKDLEKKPQDEQMKETQRVFREQYLKQASDYISNHNLSELKPGMSREEDGGGEVATDAGGGGVNPAVLAGGAAAAAGVAGVAAMSMSGGGMRSSAMGGSGLAGVAAAGVAGAGVAGAMAMYNANQNSQSSSSTPGGSLAGNPQDVENRQTAMAINTELDALKALYKEQSRHNNTSERVMNQIVRLVAALVSANGGAANIQALLTDVGNTYDPSQMSNDSSEYISSGV